MLSWRGTNVDLDVAQSTRRGRVAHPAVAHGRETLTQPLQLPCNHGVDRGSSLFTQLDHPIRNRSLMTNCPVSVRSPPRRESRTYCNWKPSCVSRLAFSFTRSTPGHRASVALTLFEKHSPARGGQ
jgi:hypothetical protein